MSDRCGLLYFFSSEAVVVGQSSSRLEGVQLAQSRMSRGRRIAACVGSGLVDEGFDFPFDIGFEACA